MSKADQTDTRIQVVRDDPWLEPFEGEIRRRFVNEMLTLTAAKVSRSLLVALNKTAEFFDPIVMPKIDDN